jgi:tetratricopeptide (TPR) repeat protein
MERGQTLLLLREAISSARSGNRSWAQECLGRILKMDPYSEEAWLWMSLVLETPGEKRFCLEKALGINPQSAQAQAGLLYLEQQSRGPGRLVVMPKRTICPMCGEPNDRKVFQCVNCGQDLFVLCPACGERMDIDRPDCSACGQKIGDVSTGAAYFFHLGELYLEHGQAKRALDTWDKTLFLNPDYPRVAEVAAEAFLVTGQRDLAIQSLERAIEETEEEERKRELRLKLASFYREFGQHDEAHAIYQQLLLEEKERRESWTELYVELGRFHQQQGDVDEARNYYEMALTLDGKLHHVRYEVAGILRNKGYERRALNEFRMLQSVGGEIGEQAKAQIAEIRPPVPDEFRNRWQETVRGTARYMVAGLILLVLTTGRNWANVAIQNVLGLFASILGGYLLTAATATPRNLPTSAMFSKLGESPILMRMRLRSKKEAAGPQKPSFFSKFIASQRRSAQQLAAQMRVLQLRAAQALHRFLEATSKRVEKFKRSPTGKKIWKFFKKLGKTRFFQAVGRLLRQIFPEQAGLLARLGEFVRGGGKRLAEQAGKVEVREGQVYRWVAAALGIFLLLLAVRLILV